MNSKNARNTEITLRWIRLGIAAGILADLAYTLVLIPLPLPRQAVWLSAFAFGPLLSVAFIGLYHFLRLYRDSVALQAATVFGVIAGTIVNMMLVVQSAIFDAVPPAARGELGLAFDGLNMVQLGLDVSWDIYFSIAMILFGLSMLGHPRFGKIWGVAAIGIGGGLLLLNFATFPIPPAEAESVDLGPLAGLFFLAATIRIIFSMKWVLNQLA